MPIDLAPVLLGAALNLAVTVVIVRFVYYPRTPEQSYVFSYLAFSVVIYFVMGLLTTVEIGIGVGFGLFAIFSVLRYRTDEMPIREMTYLFAVIALPIMNSVRMHDGDVAGLLATNAFVVAVLFVLERRWGFHFQEARRISYDRIDLVAPDRRGALLEDLRSRTGLPIDRVDVGRLDLVRDTAELRVFFDAPQPPRVDAVGASASTSHVPNRGRADLEVGFRADG
jgi:hypothetical protein